MAETAIIEYIRADELISLIKKFITEEHLDPHFGNDVFSMICERFTPQMGLKPMKLGFEKTLVNNILAEIGLQVQNTAQEGLQSH